MQPVTTAGIEGVLARNELGRRSQTTSTEGVDFHNKLECAPQRKSQVLWRTSRKVDPLLLPVAMVMVVVVLNVRP